MSSQETADKAPPAEALSFDNLGLSESMLETLRRVEYLAPTPIQAGLIPKALSGADLMGQARTGTGKTAAFGIPILERLEPHKSGQGPQALVLVPTRELAVQVRGEIEKLSQGKKVHSIALYGGKPIKQQIDKLRRGADVIIGTPGRVLDHMSRGTLSLADLRMVVLDEADRMLDIGFRPDIEKILKRCPASRQTLLLSATVPPPVERLAHRYMRDPETLNFSPSDISSDTIEQFYFTVDPERKFDLLERLLKREQPRQAIIFCRTKRGTDKVHLRLAKRFTDVACIHGDLQQRARDRVMAGFREGAVKVLVATDVVGRGIDVSSISHIINYDIPQFCDDYVHRVGRTGRMGREGVAYTFVTPEEGSELTRIEMRIDRLLRRDEISDFEACATRTGRPANGEPVDAADPGAADLETPDAEPAAPAPAGPRPMSARRGRRHRRAL